jgi:hypothetical protein
LPRLCYFYIITKIRKRNKKEGRKEGGKEEGRRKAEMRKKEKQGK